ncbi:MAG TPA: ABC transporter substrate-binding protein [Acidimicrobiales bacterium]|jgi:peptide/nickel transport system substrate-binding protein|nr:ABC transporter substrate-binding protein [Acidimicrobiales bacterium]
MKRSLIAVAIAAAVGLGATACSSSAKPTSSNGGTGGGTSPTSAAAGVSGGVLNMLGTGDVDYLDPNITYYTTGYLAMRMISRQLVTYPAIQGQTTNIVPDLATELPTTANGGISADGLTYKLTIRTGAMWGTTPPRQVTAADEVRGVERTCNPAQPFGGLPDFETLIAGFQQFCDGFSKVSGTATAIKQYITTHSISGVSVDSTNPQTVIFHLTRPATYFLNQLAIPALSPAPVEYLDYVPASAQLAQHFISDGPYSVTSYEPAKSIVFGRNTAWTASSDGVRKAYVDKIVVSETGNQTSIQQQLATNTPAADMGWDSPVPTAAVPALLASKSPNLTLGQTFGTDPYVLFDTVSPNNGGALSKVAVRQALEYAINRTDLVQDDGGPQISPPLSHILPTGIDGSQDYDMYPNDTAKAQSLLAAAGQSHLHLKVLYQSSLGFEVSMFQTLQSDLGKAGITVTGVGVPSADFYTKYLEVPSVAKGGVWDLALAQWLPDWYGNAALSFFEPLFAGSPAFPPNGSDFGFYDDPTTDSLIQQASSATSTSQATALWAQADQQVMKDAAIFPITSPTQPVYHADQVHNAVYVPNLFQFDPTNVWLTPSANGD